MTASPHSKETMFVAHESMRLACEAVRILRDRFGCYAHQFGGGPKIANDAVLILSADLGRRKYVRILPRLPLTNRKHDLPHYETARQYGWHERAGGLVIVNRTLMNCDGAFALDHERRFINSLANVINARPPLVIYHRRQLSPSYREARRAYFAS